MMRSKEANLDSERQDWQRLGELMTPPWGTDRALSVKLKIAAQRRVHRQRIVILIASATALLTIAMWSISAIVKQPQASKAISFPAPSQEKTEMPPAPDASVAATTTASIATPLTPGTELTVNEGISTRTFQLTDGSARFKTNAAEGKTVSVRVGSLLIEDIGTVFTVERIGEGRARVAVAEGRVKLTWPDGHDVLDAGEDGVFPPEEPAPVGKLARNPTKVSDERHAPSWRESARQGRYPAAYRLIDASPSIVEDNLDDLLLAADVMRLTGHSDLAVKYLDQAVSRHGRDPRSSLAAFTLGRVFLDELGRPRQAAMAFAAVRKGKSPLQEEALAREVESWSRAGEVGKSRAAAELYLKMYPAGPRIEMVRAFGDVKATAP